MTYNALNTSAERDLWVQEKIETFANLLKFVLGSFQKKKLQVWSLNECAKPTFLSMIKENTILK